MILRNALLVGVFFFCVVISANEVVIGNWISDLNGWNIDKKKGHGVKLVYNGKMQCLEAKLPGDWKIVAVNDDVDLPEIQHFKIMVKSTPDLGWVNIFIVVQSDKKQWDSLANRKVVLDGEWQTFTWDFDSSLHKETEWSKIAIVLNSENKGSVYLKNFISILGREEGEIKDEK